MEDTLTASADPLRTTDDGARTGRGPGGAARFSGWRIVALSAAALALTAPGQTAGISVFIDPLIADLGIGRTAISTAYLTGTLVGACAMPLVGRAVDRYGPRAVMAVIGAVFGAVLLALSLVSGIVGLTAGFVGVRMAGQGALTLVATTTVAYWFDRRRGLALGITSAVGAAGISLAPVLIEALIADVGWRRAWAIEGLVIWALVVPIALLGIRNRPADLGQHVDGIAPTGEEADGPEAGMTLRQALRSGMFWAVAACLAASSMLVTGLNFHQIGLLGEQGLSPTAAAANFLPQTLAALLASFTAGVLIDRVAPKAVLVAAMGVLAAAVLSVGLVGPGWSALAFGFLLGGSGGILRSVEAAAYPRYFGTAHLGAIRGSAHTISVGGSAFGPLAVSLGRDLTGSYAPAMLAFAALPALAALLVLTTREPSPPAATRPTTGRGEP
ncbi:MFS transporter [Streptomyces sp. GSL17-111]|uniref:MFS transporter n=1 Tax=Streptomyces sp. GSL17-111 TaxID=3121596 RepID=UPI0030F3DBE4